MTEKLNLTGGGKAVDLDEALDRALAGEGAPQDSVEIAQLVALAASIQGLAAAPPPDPVALATGRRRMLEAAGRLRQKRESGWRGALGRFWGGDTGRALRRHPLAAGLAGLLFLVVSAGGGAMAASSDSLPDSPLYGVKLAGEQVEMLLTRDAQAQDSLKARLEERRRQETEEMERRHAKPTRRPSDGELTATPSATALAANTPDAAPGGQKPSHTPKPDKTQERDRQPEPTATPRPQKTPEPTGTPDDGGTPQAGITRTPELTATPRREGGSTKEPTPTRTGTPIASRTPETTPTVTATITMTVTMVPTSLQTSQPPFWWNEVPEG